MGCQNRLRKRGDVQLRLRCYTSLLFAKAGILKRVHNPRVDTSLTDEDFESAFDEAARLAVRDELVVEARGDQIGSVSRRGLVRAELFGILGDEVLRVRDHRREREILNLLVGKRVGQSPDPLALELLAGSGEEAEPGAHNAPRDETGASVRVLFHEAFDLLRQRPLRDGGQRWQVVDQGLQRQQ